MKSETSKDPSLPDSLKQGVVYFNKGRYFDAHESWEDLWRESTGAPRLYYQGLVQVAVGLHHLSTGNISGGTRVVRRGLDKLEGRPGRYRGIDNRRFVADIRNAIEAPECPRIRIHTAGSHGAPSGDGPDETV